MLRSCCSAEVETYAQYVKLAGQPSPALERTHTRAYT